ncbi:phosphatidylinositol glycantransferase-class A [Thermococcus onnurineus NA1]|uniref:Phosphatidylinositol glycantransferase-class A n=1 Tax=Thermococcus onnurineus (strain NA1) TaxID=523850 RepID=B6YVM5_THEON|nr:glycosyltransferase family 4 protein [Thermococcus onnurineus]ACJ17349.1 phosphatidylinositol glycantransferase-class A [Thermococcus onnurineus NA1]
MKIAMLISTPFPPEEGIGYYTYNLSKKLIERGHEVTVITRGSPRNIEHFYFDGIEVYKPQFFPVYPLHVHIHKLFIERFFRKLGKDFDVIHIHSPLSPFIKHPLNDIPIVSTVHTSLIEDIKHYQVHDLNAMGQKLTTYAVGYPLTMELLESSDVVTTVSSAVAREIQEYYGRTPLILGNGVDEGKFYPADSREGGYLLYVGRLDYRKGVIDLIKAAQILKENTTTTKILIVGKGPLYNEIKAMITRDNLDNVELLGHVPWEQLLWLYRNAEVFIFPSHYEGLPTVVLEAMASGLPVVASDIPAHRDVIINGHNGLLSKRGSPESIAENVLTLLENEKLQRKLGRNARKTIERKFTWGKIGRKFERIYESATS